MIQQGQVFKLKAKGADGQPLWAYRYRLEGRGSVRPQVGGFASRAEAQKALRKALDRIGPGRGGRDHARRARRGVPGAASGRAGDDREAALAARQSDRQPWRQADRGSVAEGGLRVAVDASGRASLRGDAGAPAGSQPGGRLGAARLQPGEAGCSEPAAAAEGEAAVRVVGADRGVAARLGPVYGPMVVFAAATGLRPSELFGLEQHDVDREAGVVYVRRAFANGRIKHTKTRLSTRAVPLQAKAVEALDRLPASVNPILFPNARGGRIDFRIFGRTPLAAGTDHGRDRADPRALRPAPHLRHLRAPRRRSGVRGLALHRLEHRDDRPPLRPPRPRQPRARRLAARRARARAGGGRCVDVDREARKRAQQQQFEASSNEKSRRVDARWTPRLVLVASPDNERS